MIKERNKRRREIGYASASHILQTLKDDIDVIDERWQISLSVDAVQCLHSLLVLWHCHSNKSLTILILDLGQDLFLSLTIIQIKVEPCCLWSVGTHRESILSLIFC